MTNNSNAAKSILRSLLETYDRFAYQTGDALMRLTGMKKQDKQETKQMKLTLEISIWERIKVFIGQFSFLGQILKYAAAGLLIIVVLATIFPLLPIKNNYELLVVMSGSMTPAVRVGSIALVKPAETYNTGDVITFAYSDDPEYTITHRIHEITGEDDQQVFTTKGDANEEPDQNTLLRENIKGKMLLAVPYLGYLVNFSKTTRGFMLLVILPAVFIILDELRVIRAEVVKQVEKKKKKE
ncbi:signal peptidase I [Patescibacteria group bacterium]|nr:signal peptidase I [Patescibacteria group bacterium]